MDRGSRHTPHATFCRALVYFFERARVLLYVASHFPSLVQCCVCSLAKTYADFISYSITQATDTSNIRLVFVTVKETILHNALKESGIL